jgi:hypothetical protein
MVWLATPAKWYSSTVPGNRARYPATPANQGPLPDSGQRQQESANLMPWYCVHSEGGDTQDQSKKWRPEAATDEQQDQRQQDQHQATAPALHKQHRPNRQCQGNDHGQNATKQVSFLLVGG